METLARNRNLVKTNEMLHVKVINANRDVLGKIYEIVMNKISGQAEYIVLESGSFLGLGGKFFAIPWSAIHYDIREEAFVIDASKAALDNSLKFDKDNWPDYSDQRWGRRPVIAAVS